MGHVARLTLLVLLCLASVGARAELVYYWAYIGFENTCTTATPHATCDLTAGGAYQKKAGTSIKSMKATSGSECTTDFYAGVYSGTGNNTYGFSSAYTTTTCVSVTPSPGIKRASSPCDTSDPGAPCYVEPPPPPYDCTQTVGTKKYFDFDGITEPSGVPREQCGDVGAPGESCIFELQTVLCLGSGSAAGCTGSYKQMSGLACTKAPTDPEAWDTGEKCKTLASGLQFCHTANADNAQCGFVNNSYVCLKTIYPDGCKVLGDGSRICGKAAPSPPKPDSGTPGDPATPDATSKGQDVAGGNGGDTENDFYTPTTSQGSSRDPGDGSNPTGTGGSSQSGTNTGTDSDGDGEADPESEYPRPLSGTASGGLTCEAPPTCTHGDAVQCAQLRQQWETRCAIENLGGTGDESTEADVLGAIGATDAEKSGDLSHGITGGNIADYLNAEGPYAAPACPGPLSVTMFGQTMSFDLWDYACQFALAFAPFVMVMGYLQAAAIMVRGTRK